MPHTQNSASRKIRIPVWDSSVSIVRYPVVLIEGFKASIIEADTVMTQDGRGREIYAEWMPSIQVRSEPKKEKYVDDNGEKQERTVYEMRTMKCYRRKSDAPGLRGESSKMTPGRPTDGDIAISNYGINLDGFAAGHSKAVRLFKSRRSRRWGREGVSHALTQMTHQGSILYMPHAGPQTAH